MTVPSAAVRREANTALAAAEVALFGVHLAVVIGFARLYRGNNHLVDLIAFTVAASLLAAGTRRRRVRAPVAGIISVVGLLLVATWVLFPATTTFGLPTIETWHAAGDALRVSREAFRTVAAPTTALTGFQLISGIAMWGAVWFADWAAFRLRTTAEAIAPAGIVFIFGAVLGSGSYRYALAALFGAAVLVFAATHQALRSHLDQTWLTTSHAQGPRAVLRAGIATAVVAVSLGALIAPVLPGADATPLVRWRARGSPAGLRSVVSPIVDLRRRLVTQSNIEMFRVTTDHDSYWRLTSLDLFDGQTFTSGGEYAKVKSKLPSSSPSAATTQTINQRFEIKGSASIWAPGAFEPVALKSSNMPVVWNSDSSTLIVDSSVESSDGLSYELVSESPRLDPTVLRRANGADPADLDRHYQALPSTFPLEVRDEARRAVAGGATRYDRARQLQDYFQSGEFTYSTDVPPGHGDNALVSFLEAKRGYCEQFAGAYTAMARSVGIPARVAIGFTKGDPNPEVPGQYIVRGIHAHAWPEVYFPGEGWVPFEPTPGRGIPDAEQYTGIPEAQAESQPEVVPQTSTSTTAPLGSSTTAPTRPDSEGSINRDSTVGQSTGGSATGPDWTRLAWAAVLLAAGWLAVILAAPAIRAARRRQPHQPSSRALDAWNDALAPIRWATGLAPAAAETHLEFARRTEAQLGDQSVIVHDLAALATRATWDPKGLDAAQGDHAAALAKQLRREIASSQSLITRIRRHLSWREAFDVSPSTHTGLPLAVGS